MLAVPTLIFVLGESAQAATTGSLFIVGVTSVISAIAYHRDEMVRWRAGLGFGAAGILASVGGSVLNRQVSEEVVIICFAGLMLISATAMFLKSRRRPGTTEGQNADQAPFAQSATVVVQVVLAGLVVGFLTGFLGVGGGFVIVPALILILRFPTPVAVGTSLLIIAVNSGVSLLARAGVNEFSWGDIIPFTVAAVAASLIGKRLSARLPARRLNQALAGLLVLVAVFMTTKTLWAPT
ncbi:sulfite exporter TauE/SafE family protein [Propionibacteriaceae bacterium Y2011]